MTWLACLEWMMARGYRELMWPCMQIEGTIAPTQTESLADALRRGDDRSTRGRRYFVGEAPSMRGDICAWVYGLPADLHPADVLGERREIEKLRDGPQHIQDRETDSYYAYVAAGVGRICA
jgi:hypothetical protein